MPSKAIELTAFDAYKKLLSHEDANGKLKRPGPLLTALAGAAAGGDFHLCLPLVPSLELQMLAPMLTKLSYAVYAVFMCTCNCA